jgi:hypothetical protein
MRKQLDTASIMNELKGGSLFFAGKRSEPTPPPQVESGNVQANDEVRQVHTEPMDRAASRPVEQPPGQVASRPVDQLNGPPGSQSVSQSTNPSADQSTVRSIDRSTILGRPKSFYITEKQNHDLDLAVQKLTSKVKGKVNQKIDRSTVIRLLLEVSQLTTDELIERLASQLVRRLVSQLTS